MGGINHVVAGADNSPIDSLSSWNNWELATMVLGVDISRPAPGSGARSVAAVVGSTDETMTRYTAEMRRQDARADTVVEFGAMVKELLKEFYTSMKERFPSYRWCPAATNEGPWLPKRIVIFRDGVSDGEFRDVLDREVRQLLLVFEEVFEEMRGFHPEWHEYLASRGGYQPLLTVIVVQKNHGTRLFPAPRDPNNPGDPSVNVAAGTVVDRGITSRDERDFFLVSHQGIRGGTVRPAHYRVILDNMDIDADTLQTFCFRLCHAYSRATKSVSIVAPLYLAKLATQRGRIHAPDFMGSDTASLASGESGGAGGGGAEESTNILGAKSADNFVHPSMFFI